MSLLKKLDDFELAFSDHWKKYMDLHKQLDKYRGIDLQDKFEEANEIIRQITDTMIEMYPALEFILKRAKMADDALKHYNAFIETLKTVGAVETPIEDQTEAKA